MTIRMRINVYGKILSHLRFADDILLADKCEDTQRVSNRPFSASFDKIVKINFAKKVKNNDDHRHITVDEIQPELFQKYIYLSQSIKLTKKTRRLKLTEEFKCPAHRVANYLL